MVRVDRVTTFKIFIKNLPDGTTQDELKMIFEEYGRVVECEIFRNTFAFVHMEEEACGKLAVSMLNGRNVRGNTISVLQSNQSDLGPKIASTRLCVKNIPASLSAAGLRDLFKKYGLVLAAEITNETGIVNLEAMGDLKTAINEVNGFVYEGHTLTVQPFVNTADTYSPKTSSTRPMPLMPGLRVRPLFPPHRSEPLLPNPQIRNRFNPQKRGFRHYDNSYEASDPNFYEDEHNAYEEPPQTFGPRSASNPSSWQPPAAEGRVLRDPYGPRAVGPPRGLRPQMQHNRMLRPPMMGHSMQYPGPLFNTPMQSARPPFVPRPRLVAPVNRNNSPKPNIEPLFLRRHEILNSNPPQHLNSNRGNKEFYEDESFEPPARYHPELPSYAENEGSFNNSRPPHRFDEFYSDEPLEPPTRYQQEPDRIPIYRGTNGTSLNPPPLMDDYYNEAPTFRRNGSLLNSNSNPPPLMDNYYNEAPTSQRNTGFLNNNSRPPPLLRNSYPPPPPPPMSNRHPTPLFQGNRPIKRNVPQADPGQAFEVPAMIAPGVFQPPRKYFANRTKAPAKKKKRSEPGPQLPIPDEPHRPVPDFNTQSRFLPKGTVLRAFPPPLMNQNFDFAEDPNLY